MAEWFEDSMLAGQRERIQDQAERIALSLEEMAGSIRDSAREVKVSGLAEEVLISRTIHIITWGTANLSIDGLVSKVADLRKLEAAVKDRERRPHGTED